MNKSSNLEQEIQDEYTSINRQLKILVDSDPQLNRQDSCKGAVRILQQTKKIIQTVNALGVEERARYYYLTYNAVSYILDISALIRNSNYSFEAIKFLLDCIGAMEGNLILQDVKYLDRRIRIYLDVCHIYEEGQFYTSALTLLENGIQKIKELKNLHQQDPPVPTHVTTILTNSVNILKIMVIKYSLQSGSLSSNDWKKKVDQEFGTDNKIKLMCLVECLRTETRRKCNVFNRNTYSGKAYKEALLQAGYDMVKPSIDILTKALNQQKQKIEREVDFRTNENRTQEIINEEIKKKRQAEQNNIKEKDYKKASHQFPLEVHTELIHYCLETKNNKFMNQLVEAALLRIQCRRIQVPYVNDVAIIASNSTDPNIPNGYEKIPVDLNEANLKAALRKLRNSGKKKQDEKPDVIKKDQIKKGQIKKDQKKGGKEPPPQQEKSGEAPTEWQLEQIKHKYVFMIIKKSMSPENAIYDMRVVLGDEQKGPVGFPDTRRIIIPYIQENMKSIQSQISQYPGVKESSHQVPYIVLYHSKDSLQNEEEKKTLITDIKPLIGRNPMIPPEWGYNKIPFDLRQVPPEFIKAAGHDYVYLTYKTDEQFNINSRHVQILHALSELEKSHPKEKGSTIEEQRLLEMEINFDLAKLQRFFSAVQNSLQGFLGQEYYQAKNDFLTHLSFYIWTKYLRGPLIQFQYIQEQRLHEEIIDYDYGYYKDMIEDCKRIFLKGLRVLNLILVNNRKSDILLLSRVNLELVKYLEEVKEYKTGAESALLCLQRIWEYRDQYLSRGIDNSQDKLLPFSVTCSNVLIADTISRMKVKYQDQRREINKTLRIKDRKKKQQKPLDSQQLTEEHNQYVRFQKKDQIDQTIDKVSGTHSQLISILSAIELDIGNMYFRVSLKYADQIKKRASESANLVTNGIKNTELEGMSSTLVQKLHLMSRPNQMTNQKNLKQLQSTLVNANQISPPKPSLHRAELKLLQTNQKNPYMLALLLMNLGAINSGNQEKKYFLRESLESIIKAKEIQKSMCEDAVKNSMFLFSTLWDHQLNEDKNSLKVSPFKELYDGTWPSEVDVPPPPILVNKNSHSISMKLPPYKPKKLPMKKESQIKSMSLYGKVSANGVDVSTNCNQLVGTGLKKQIGKVVKVTGLTPNNLYCFAVAGTNENEELQPIGKTGTDVGSFHPLPIAMLASYLAKISYQIYEFEISEKAARIVLQEMCEKSGYLTEDERNNNLYLYRFNERVLKSLSLPEIRSIAQAFFILALCERKKLTAMRPKLQSTPIVIQEKEKQITNLIMLSGFLTPSLSCPLSSLPFLIPDREVMVKSFIITLIPSKWMNPRLRQLGVRVMQKALKWGLQNNQISLTRRIAYRWIERKWLMLGKIIQVEQKKEAKKGAKDSKEQQAKMIDKYCRFIVQKSPGIIDSFEESMATVSEEYSDYVTMFVERAKQQISNLSQYVDNPPDELEALLSGYNMKLQLLENLKNPAASIGKVPNTSPFYLQHNCKLLKRALQILPEAQQKTLAPKCEQINIANKTPELQLAEQIRELMMEAVSADIEWSPQSKNLLINLQKKTGKDLSKAIGIFNKYEQKMTQLTDRIGNMYSFLNKYNDFDYLNLWLSQLFQLKAISFIIANAGSFNVNSRIPGRYDKVKGMSLNDLLKKGQQMAILDKTNYSYSEDQNKKLIKILQCLAKGAYSAYVIQNWIKFQNIVKVTTNLIAYELMTPFYHSGSQIWIYLSLISLFSIFMMQNIRKNGFNTYKRRFQKKTAYVETDGIAQKLQMEKKHDQPVVAPFYAVYYQLELDQSTTKQFWFGRENKIDLEAISSLICYTVQTLRIESKFNLVINLVRQFCNVTQHYYSLQFLPFMIESQQKLQQTVLENISAQKNAKAEALSQYQKQKNSKKKGARQAQITGQKPRYEVEYQQKSKKINDSLSLLEEQQDFIMKQCRTSKTIIQQIVRDSSKAVLQQRQQRKFMIEFAHDEQHMARQYGGQEARLARNRKNVVKDIINRYNQIYDKLKNNKTSKDTLAEIQNRNDVGNLYYAAGNIQKADEHWNDALSTIFKIVDPINNISQIIEEKQPFMVNIIGLKESMVAVCLLYKMTKFSSFKEVRKQKKSTELACLIMKSIYETDERHPQNLVLFSQYRLKSLAQKEPFEDEITINLAELVTSLQFFALRAIDENWALQSLPLVTLLDYIATDLVKNKQLSIRSKIIKTIALAQSGLIAESVFLLIKIANEKDLPMVWLEKTDVVKKEKGQYWFPEGPSYNNGKAWNQPENKEAIELFKKLAIRSEFPRLYGITNPILFKYSKALIQYKIYQTEICDNFQTNELRLQNLLEAEGAMRQCLKKLSVTEQFYQLLETFQTERLAFRQNQVNEQLKAKMEASKNKVLQYLKSNGNDEETTKVYMKEQASALKRSNLLQTMCRIRFNLAKMNQCKNMYSNSFFILKTALSNLNRYSSGARTVQMGIESEGKSKAFIPINQSGKKDEKKGVKKQQQPKVQKVPEIDQAKEKQVRIQTQARKYRTTVSAYWHLKFCYGIGKVMFKQNRFKTAIKVFQDLAAECIKYQEEYFFLYAKGYVCRCMVRLGKLVPGDFEAVIKEVEDRRFFDEEFVCLVVDFGELSEEAKRIQMFLKGRKVAEDIWLNNYKTATMAGIKSQQSVRVFSGNNELTAEQEEQVKKKGKKAEQKGKDDKKAAKKQDPKKKKQQSKLEYKVQPICKYQWHNLLEEEKNALSSYTFQPHPNFHHNNIHNKAALLYIKCHLRLLRSTLYQQIDLDFDAQIVSLQKLLYITETYPYSSYVAKLNIYSLLGSLNKRIFVNRLGQLTSNNKKIEKVLIVPFEDFPLNSELIKLPSYMQFLSDNLKYLKEAVNWYQKISVLVKNGNLFLEFNFPLQEVFWQMADTHAMLAEYKGRETPKYFPPENVPENVNFQLEKMNSVLCSYHSIQLSYKVARAYQQLLENYVEIGAKNFEGNAKLDEDLVNQILQMDQEYKFQYPQFLSDYYKVKTTVSTLDIVTYMAKIFRQAQYMTFSNSHLQNILLKCNRVLMTNCLAYKERCILTNTQIALKNDLAAPFLEADCIAFKSRRIEEGQRFLYVIAPLSGESEEHAIVIYGRVNFNAKYLSGISEQLFSLRSKIAISDKKSENAKKRDYIWHQRDFVSTLTKFAKGYNPEIEFLPDEIVPQLTYENTSTLIDMISNTGKVVKNTQINKMLRSLHERKYKIQKK